MGAKTETVVAEVRRIMVLRANALGDFLLALPALAALRAAYPNAELALLGQRWVVPFLVGRPGPVDVVVPLPRVPGVTAPPPAASGEPPGRRVERFTGWLRDQRPDLALQWHGGGRHSNPFVAALGARVTAGLRAEDAPPLDRTMPYVYHQHETCRYLEAAALVGADPAVLPATLTVTARDEEELRKVTGAPPPGLVALHPGATDPRRRWPADRFAQVGDALAGRGHPVAVTGTRDEEPVVREVVDRMRHPARPLVSALSIGGLAALYRRCALVVSNDTGPRHLAEAVGCPTVSVYWCGNLINAGPLFRGRHRPHVSWTVACPACGASAVDGSPRCPHDVSFVAAVTAEEVISSALDLVSETPAPPILSEIDIMAWRRPAVPIRTR